VETTTDSSLSRVQEDVPSNGGSLSEARQTSKQMAGALPKLGKRQSKRNVKCRGSANVKV